MTQPWRPQDEIALDQTARNQKRYVFLFYLKEGTYGRQQEEQG
jgi:hypothetical protein